MADESPVNPDNEGQQQDAPSQEPLKQISRTDIPSTDADHKSTAAAPSQGAPGSASAPTQRTRSARTAGKPSVRGSHAQEAYVSVPKRLLIVVASAAAVLLVAAIVVIIAQCTAQKTTTRQVETTPVETWVSPYNWDNVREDENGLMAYYLDGEKVSEAGVDVSAYDGAIDWAAVKASGIDFAMIRLGYRGYTAGGISLDDYFLSNIVGASEAGLKVGVYFFSQATTAEEAIEEANLVLTTLQGTGVALSYPIAFDEEPITNGDEARTDNLTSAELTACALAFCQTIEAAGYQAVIYGNQHDLAKLDLKGDLASYELWYAEYGVSTVDTHLDFAMWQYTSSGTVGGMENSTGATDVNIRFIAS